MKLQKQVAIISATVSGISLIFSFVLNIFDLKILTYLSNIFIGLFSSGILICVVAIITYLSERNKMLYQLYCACLDFSQVLPFGKLITTQDDFLALRPDVVQAISIYNKNIQFLLDELSALRKKSEIKKTIDTIRMTLLEIYNAVLEVNDNISLVMCHEAKFTDISKKKLKISSNEVMEASDKYAKSVTDLVTFIKHKKIHKWEEPKNAH